MTAEAAAPGEPLILDAKDELLFFRSAQHLEAYVEAQDVVDGAYGACWDAAGRLMGLAVEDAPVNVLGVVRVGRQLVRVHPLEDEPSRLAELHLALLRHISACNLEAEMPTSNDTADLLAFAVEHAGWT